MKRLIACGAALGLLAGSAFAQTPNFDDPEEFERQRQQLQTDPMGPEGQPWVQYLDDAMVDTSQYAKEGPYTVCFSNAGVNNPWRVVGYTNMQAEIELHSEIGEFVHVDAEGSDDKQIADIGDLLAGGNCDIMIVSPNTTAALTPAVEQACEQMPVIVFDRGVNTDCPVTFIHPVGGYGFGIQGAEFVADNVDEGANVLMLRILPGVDVLETRYSAGRRIFEEAASTSSAPSSPMVTMRAPSRSSRTTSSAARLTPSGWMPGPPRLRPSKPSRTAASTCRFSSVKTSRIFWSSGATWA